MAKIGLSKPYFAKYSNTGETVTYSGGALMGKAVELSIELRARMIISFMQTMDLRRVRIPLQAVHGR